MLYQILLTALSTEQSLTTMTESLASSNNSSEGWFLSVDWTQFIPEMIATLVGFGLALLGSKIYDNYKDKGERKRLVSSLVRELLIIDKTIDNLDLSLTWIKPIKYPVWDSAINANKIALIDDTDWFRELCDLYDDVQDYNEWHLLKTNLSFLLKVPGDSTSITTVLRKLSEDIKKKIAALLNTIESDLEVL